MREKLQTAFQTRQYMLSNDFELYYYVGRTLSRVDVHNHDYYEFYFFLEGDIEIEIEGKKYPVRVGDIMLIPPGVSHRPIIRNTKIPYRRFVFWISCEYCEKLLKEADGYGYIIDYIGAEAKYIFHTSSVYFNSIQSKFFGLLEEIHSKKFARDTQIDLCIKDLVLCINRSAYEQSMPQEKCNEAVLYQRISEYVEEHIEENLSLEELSKKFFASKYHIAHIFKDNVGISIHQYIMKKRLNLCREAISGQTGITKVYRMYGFGDYSCFYRAFKKEYGISPKDYRDMKMYPDESYNS